MKRKGFGIAETLLSSVIIASLMLGFVGIMAAVSHLGQLNYRRAVAADLAQQKVEEIRYQIESNWVQRDPSKTELASADWFRGINPSTATKQINGVDYQIAATIDHDNAVLPELFSLQEDGTRVGSNGSTAFSSDALYRRIKVKVTWNDGVDRTYELVSIATNWREGTL